LGKRRNGISSTAAIVLSSGRRLRSSPSPSRLFVSMYQAKSRRSTPTESIVPPVRINPTLGKTFIATETSPNPPILCGYVTVLRFHAASLAASGGAREPKQGQRPRRTDLREAAFCEAHER